MMYSGAVVAGLSSVFLVVAMSVQYILIPVKGTADLPRWASLDAYWFLLNASLTILFLYRTIEFLNRDVQLDVAKKYAANIALPRDFAKLYKAQLVRGAQKNGWIPVPSYLDLPTTSMPTVLLGSYGLAQGAGQCAISMRGPSRLHNIRLWLLRAVVMSWHRRALKAGAHSSSGSAGANGGALLVIAVNVGSVYTGEVQLARVDKGPPLHRREKVLLRWALTFKAIAREKADISVEALILEFKSELIEAMDKGNVDVLDKAFRDLTGMHKLLLDASFVEFDDGTVGSVAVFSGQTSMFSNPMDRDWLTTYRSVFQAAIRTLEEDSALFEKMCHLPLVLHTDTTDHFQVEIVKNILALPKSLMYYLGLWWERQIEHQGHADHNHNREAGLQYPANRTYKDALHHFVQAWENVRTYYMPQPKDTERVEWKLVQRHVALVGWHLEQTVRLLLAAVTRGDREAAEWFADVVSKWWGRNAAGTFVLNLHGKTQLLTISHLALEWNQVVNTTGIANAVTGLAQDALWRVQYGVMLAALKNHWTDIRITTVCLLLSMAADGTAANIEASLAFDIALGFMQGKRWREGGIAVEHLQNISTPDYLIAMVRQEAADINYTAQLASLVDDVKGRNAPRMLSSRVYVQHGSDGGLQIREMHLAFLQALSKSDWQIPAILRNEIGIWMLMQHPQLPSLRSMFSSWKTRLDDPEEAVPDLVNLLLQKLGRQHSAAEGRARVGSGFSSVMAFMTEKRTEILRSEGVSPQRLETLGAYASSTGFNQETANFPMQLFAEVKFVDADLEDCGWDVRDISKGELTDVQRDQPPINLDDFWAQSASNAVASVALSDVFRACASREVVASDASAYWAVLKVEMARMHSDNLHPVLIVDNPSGPEWLFQWEWGHLDAAAALPRPADMQIAQERDKERDDSYLFSINGMPIYWGHIEPGISILIAREAFAKIEFKRYAIGRYVDVTANEQEGNPLRCDLHAKFSRRVSVEAQQLVRIRYRQRD